MRDFGVVGVRKGPKKSCGFAGPRATSVRNTVAGLRTLRTLEVDGNLPGDPARVGET